MQRGPHAQFGRGRSTRMPLAVILDMDGLLLDTEPISLRVWKQAASELGYDLTDAVCERMIGMSQAANRAMLLEHFGSGLPADALVDRAQAHYRRALDEGGVPHKPGLTAFIRFLDERRIPRAVATSTATALASHKLHQAGVLHHFTIVVGGDQVSRGKPEPDIFLMAAERLERRPEHCVVLEDSGPGVRAALAAGMRSILIPDLGEPAIETRRAAHAVVKSLLAAVPVIEAMLDMGSRAAADASWRERE
jgi:HAD superfamily hydrolase (TIGR01509 family)